MNNTQKNAETQLQVAIGTLLIAVTDKSSLVVESVKNSLKKLSEKHPNQVLTSCCKFNTRIPKPPPEHLASILTIMEAVCSDYIVDIDGCTIIEVIHVCLTIMTENVNPQPLVEMPASEVLVALGREHYVQVMDLLINKMNVGVVPHYMVPHTLGSLANANANGVVPYLKDILNILVPLLGGIKTDILKQSFSYALGNFCDALIEYISNNEKVPDPTISLDNYNVEIGMVYDVLFTTWLYSREAKVAESVLDALSPLFRVLNVDRVTQHTTKAIQVLLNLYKKNIDPYHITKCLESIIQKAATVNGTLLEPVLPNIFNTIFDLVCISPDYAQPGLLKSHSEVLRCYECFALHFTDGTTDQLLQQLRNNNDKERVKSLIVLTHLVSHSRDQAINRRFKDIVRHISDLLSDNNIRVKKALVKIIVALSIKKVLLDTESNPNGPEKYMEFILKMCCRQTLQKNNDADQEELQNIQMSADNTLFMLSTSVPELEQTLWDLLIRCFLGPAYDDAIVIILRCLTHLASKKERLESCEAAFVRCLSLLSNPLPNFRGCFLLNFLKNVKPYNVDSYKAVWDVKIPQLLKYLEQNYENFNSQEWQDLIFDFLNILLETTDNGAFNEIVVHKAKEQLAMYDNIKHVVNGELHAKQTEKQFLIKCLAVALCYLKDKETVTQTLDVILSNVKLTDYSDLHTCAEAVGICSRVHLQIVLDKLVSIRKEVIAKKSSKFLNFTFMKNHSHELGIERLRYTILYSYSAICNEAPADKLLRIVEGEILDYAMTELVNCKDFQMRKVCLRTIHSVADAMHPNRNSLHIRMNDRDNVMKLVSSQIHLHSGPEYIELFPLIIPAVTALVRLPLPIESEDRIRLLKVFFDNVFNASAIYCKINPENADSYYGDLKLVPYVARSFTEVNLLVQELLLQDISPATLDEIVTLLEPWLGKKKPEQRLPAAETLRLVMQTYLDNMKFAYDCPTSFGQTGFLLAKVVPRCTDPNKKIRKVAIDCLCLILCIASRYEGHMRDHDKVLSNSLQHIQMQIETDDPKLLYNLASDLAQIICVHLPAFQLMHCVEGLSDALMDCESSSSNGSSVVLKVILKNKGGELQSHVSTILDKLLRQLYKIQCARTKSSTFRCILNLAMHHSKSVCGILLSQALPYDSVICECWAFISTDATLVQDLLDQLKKYIKSTPIYEEQGDAIKVANSQPLQAISALHEILKNVNLKDILLKQFPEMFAILLVSVASYIGTISPVLKKGDKKEKTSLYFNRDAYKIVPSKVAVDTFRLFLIGCGFEKMATSVLFINSTDSLHEMDLFLEVVAALVDNIRSETPDSLPWVVASLGPHIRADLEPERAATVALFACLLRQADRERAALSEDLLEMVLDVHGDASCAVRRLALQGLGHAAEHLERQLVERHCNQILSALVNSLDYHSVSNESAVILEGMLSLSKLLSTMEGCKFSSFQVTAAVRIKPLLDQEDANLRRASFRLLGDLTNSLNSDANLEAFREQIHGNLINLMLHLCDPDVFVVKACKYTLRKIGPHLDSPKVNSMIQEHLIDEANLHFTDFIRDFVKIMALELQDLFPLLIMTCLSYFKSQWAELKGNAALIAGLLFSLLIPENKSKVSIDMVCDRLLRLLADENEDVRIKTVEAISYLFLD